MRILPILFNTDMVRAIQDDLKTVTRRVIKPQPTYTMLSGFCWKGYVYGSDLPPTLKGAAYNFRCNAPYQPGDILYVRETYRVESPCRWRPSIHMPKEAARIWLKVTDVRIEQLQNITIKDIRAEGLLSAAVHAGDMDIAMQEWKILWNSTIKKPDLDRYGWDANPWVWVIGFERCEKPEGV